MIHKKYIIVYFFTIVLFILSNNNLHSQISSFPYFESFESDPGDWTNASGDDFNWTWNTGVTPSNNTGPESAHDGNYYMYTEASNPNFPDKTTYLEAVFDFSGVIQPELTFYYHMYGEYMGTLYLDVYDGEWNLSVWSRSGQQHAAGNEEWTKATIDLSAFGEQSNITLRFRGVTGSDASYGYMGDMAIDRIYCEDACLAVDPGTATATEYVLCSSGTVDLTLSDYTPGSFIQWQSSSDNISYSDIPGATSPDYTTPALTPGNIYYYRAAVTDGCTVVSNVVAITVNSGNGTINSFPYSESFESGLGDWSNTADDDIDWTRNSGDTPSNNTGPSDGHDGSYYMFTEASNPNYPGKQAYLEATFDFTNMNDPYLKFFFHMFGSDMGTLYIDVNTDGEVWKKIGEQHAGSDDAWTEATVDISEYAGYCNVRIRFRGKTGNGFRSDMAIDDIYCYDACLSVEGGTAISSEYSLCAEGTVDLTLSGYEEGASILWQSSPDNITFSDIPGATSEDYTSPALTPVNTYYYMAAVTSGCTAYSDTVAIYVSNGGGGISTFPYSESFESDLGDWTNAGGDDMDWTRISGSTPSNNTGPEGANEGSYYLFTEASNPNYPDKSAFLETEFDFTSVNTPYLIFYYHMFGEQMGAIHVDVNDQNSVWYISGQQQTSGSAEWKKAVVDLSGSGGHCNVTIRFRGITGSGYRSDMAIDYVYVYDACLTVETGDVTASDNTLCEAGSVDLSITGYQEGASLQWQSSPDNLIFSDITDATSENYTTPTLTPVNNYYYRVAVTDGCTAYSDTTVISVTNSGSGISIYPYSESFESGFGDWSNVSGDFFNWTRNSGGTPSGNTGPSGASDGSYYIYTEASDPNYPEKDAFLEAEFDFSDLANPRLTFEYFMFGADMGTLHLDVNNDNSVWSITGQQHTSQGDPWSIAEADMSAYGGECSVIIRFRGVTADDYTGDIAVDNISVCGPPNTSEISGSDSVCTGAEEIYYVEDHPPDTYEWIITGGTQTGGGDTDSITVQWDNTGKTGEIKVVESNGCDGDTVSLAVVIHTVAPQEITGLASVEENSTGESYFVDAEAGYAYNWTITGGAQASGENTNAITVDWGSAGAGNVSVEAVTGCGTSDPVDLPVTIYGTINSIVSGDWSQNTTWECDCVPGPTDNVSVKNGHTVILTGNTTIDNINIEAGAILNNNGFILYVDGDYTVDGTHTGDGTDNSRIYLQSDPKQMNGTGSVSNIGQIRIMDNITIPAGADLDITGDLRLYTGVTITNNGKISIIGDMFRITGDPEWTNDEGSVLNITGALLNNGILNVSAANNTVEYNGGTQDIKIPATNYDDLILSNTGIKCLKGDTYIDDDLLIAGNCQLDISENNYDIYLGGTWNNDGTNADPFMERNGALIITGDSSRLSGNISAETYYDLLVQENCIFEIPPDKGVYITGTLTIDGEFLLRSDASATAQLIDNGSINGSGKAMAERFLTKQVWHYISSPISDAKGNMIVGEGQNFYYYNESGQQWVHVENADNLEVMKGYNVYLPWNDKTEKFKGDLNTGSQSINVTNGAGGWNLVGNPYPSAIDWDAATGWTKTNVNNAIYIWNGSIDNFASYIDGAGSNGGTQYIAPGQGFWITAGGNGTLAADNDVRLIHDQPFRDDKNRYQQDMLRFTVTNNTYKDETILRFKDNSSEYYDDLYDAYKKFSYTYVPQIYTMTEDEVELSINTLPKITNVVSVPMHFKTEAEGSYTILAEGACLFDESFMIWLEDINGRRCINLRQDSVYTFSHAAGNSPNRFVIHFRRISKESNNAMDDNPVPEDIFNIYSYGNKIYISNMSDDLSHCYVEIFDIVGKKILSESLENKIINILTLEHPAGYYIIRVLSKNTIFTEKVYID